mmetsp:Transcript_7677/g.11395  ORF Transcript_7677/g.11395 Transcript_7677/m.11395 type:complete len:615 (+) Transcript_7677:76-1920(+)
MIIHPKNQWLKPLIQEENDNTKPLLLFVATNIDAITSSEMIIRLLKYYQRTFELIPVASNEYLKERLIEFEEVHPDISAILFINCGAQIPLDLLAPNLVQDFPCFVIDSQRPILLENVESHHVNLVSINETQEQFTPYIKLYKERSTDASQDRVFGHIDPIGHFAEEEDDELDNHADFLGEDSDDEDALEGFIVQDGDIMEDVPEQDLEEEADVEEDPLTTYFEEAYFYDPSSFILFETIRQMGTFDFKNNLLWCAILGLTEQLVLGRIEDKRYLSCVSQLKNFVHLWNDQKRPQYNVYYDDVGAITMYHTEDERIVYKPEEFRFDLYRHQSFYGAMLNSSSILKRYPIWNADGLLQFKRQLAKSGVRIQDMEQPWPTMRRDARKKLKTNLLHKLRSSFQGIHVSTFVKHYGVDMTVSAIDAVYCMLSLLEETSDESLSPDQLWRQNFSKVRQAVQGHIEGLSSGIHEAVRIQNLIMKQCISIISRHQVKTVGSYNYIALSNTSTDFLKPFILRRLAVTLSRLLIQQHRFRSKKPLVISVADEQSDMRLIIGLSMGLKFNRFHTFFRWAYENVNAKVQHNLFDGSILRITKHQTADFLDALHYRMNVSFREKSS